MPYFKNDAINILFIHIPKTGGSSIEKYFSRKFKIPLHNKSLFGFDTYKIIDITSSLQHMTYQQILKYKKNVIDFNNIQIIATVRNPYNRIISDLLWFCGVNRAKNSKINALKLEINPNSSREEVYEIIKKYVLSDDMDNHNKPQHIFVTDNNNELIPCIVVMRTETLKTDMHNLGYEDFDDHINSNKKKKRDYLDYLNNDSLKLINDFYDLDFRLFKYKKIDVD